MRAIAWCLAAVACLSVLAAPPVHAAGLLIADGGLGGKLEIVEHHVKVTVNNGIAVTEVEQVFKNTEKRTVEALYTFPVPQQASVSDFTMWIGGKEMIGEVVEKKRARQIYESYKRVNRDPGLLEQTDYRRFDMRIFPIAPGAEQRVRVTYYQQLEFDHDWATYVYPLASSTEGQPDSRVTGKFALTMDVLSQVPIDDMNSPSHPNDFALITHSPKYRQASLESSTGSVAKDVVLAIHAVRPKTGVDLIASRESGKDGYFLLTLTAGQELDQAGTAMDYVFLLDVSGSMADAQKLAISNRSVQAFVDQLGEDDRFELLTFNAGIESLFGELTPAIQDAKAKAAAKLGAQTARGGTDLKPAIQAAYQYAQPDRVLNVVVLSDGLTEQGDQETLRTLIAQRPARTHVFCIGVGNDVNRPLLESLAEGAGGLAAFVSRGDDFQRQASAFRRKLMHPVAENVRFELPDGMVYDIEPNAPTALFHGSPIRLFGRYRQSGPMKVTLHAEVMGRPLTQQFSLDLPEAESRNPQIERMWAWHRVNRLQKESPNNPATVKEIVDLCERYSIASEYASFIVLENDAEFQRWQIKRRNLSRLTRDQAAAASLRQELEAMRVRTAQATGPVAPPENSVDTEPITAQPSGPSFHVTPNPNVRHTAPQSPTPSSRDSWDMTLPSGGGGGGGAIDPLSAIAVVGIVGLGALARKRRAA